MAGNDRRLRLVTGNPLYRRVFDFWLKIFAMSFGMGVVTGIVMAFQFGPIGRVGGADRARFQGPLLGYEAFTAFMLEATFFGMTSAPVRDRVSPGVYFFSCCMVSLGTLFSSFWILAEQQLDAGPTRPMKIVGEPDCPGGLARDRTGGGARWCAGRTCCWPRC